VQALECWRDAQRVLEEASRLGLLNSPMFLGVTFQRSMTELLNRTCGLLSICGACEQHKACSARTRECKPACAAMCASMPGQRFLLSAPCYCRCWLPDRLTACLTVGPA
jgi:hypothetical protein